MKMNLKAGTWGGGEEGAGYIYVSNNFEEYIYIPVIDVYICMYRYQYLRLVGYHVWLLSAAGWHDEDSRHCAQWQWQDNKYCSIASILPYVWQYVPPEP